MTTRRSTPDTIVPGRSHFTCGESGWEQVADHALGWAIERTTTAAATASLQPARGTETRA